MIRTTITTCLLIGFIYLILPLEAQTFALPKFANEAEAPRIEFAEIVDFDNDGDQDILTIGGTENVFAGWIGYLENTGGGNFAPIIRLVDNALELKRFSTADLDSDGDLDLLAAFTDWSGRVVWYENLGGLNFSSEITIDPSFNFCRKAVAGDADGDGDQDVFAIRQSGSLISYFENLGGGSFAPQEPVNFDSDQFTDIELADLDGDGDIDLLSGGYSDDRVAWVENLGGGNFGPFQEIHSVVSGVRNVEAADFDNDGDLDVLATSDAIFDSIYWFENLGGALFSTPKYIYRTLSSLGIDHELQTADIDGDGLQDVLTALPDDRMAWWRNLGGGTFSSEMTFLSGGVDVIAEHVLAGDFDSDGDGDVIGVGFHRVSYIENTGGTNFADMRLLTVPSGRQESTTSADFDGDGDIDLVGGIYETNKLVFYEQQFGLLASPTVIKNLDVHPYSLRAGDLDNDGDADIAMLASALDVYWFENLGGGNFEDKVFLGSALQVGFELADVNMDGIIDLLVGSNEVILSAGGGSFGPVLPLGTLTYPYDLAAADFNGDGLMDIVNADDNKIAWHQGTAIASVGPPMILGSTVGAYEIAVADVDNDGDPDPIAADNYGAKIIWYENLGGGTFSGEQMIATAAEPDELIAVDIDLDGKVDLITRENGNEFRYYRNLGGGSFTSSLIFSNSVNSPGLHVADADNDGDIDVVLCDRYNFVFIENLTINCDPTTAVSGLSATVGVSEVTLNWDAVEGSLGCQLNGRQLAPVVSPFLTRNFSGSSLSGLSFPTSLLGAGTTWEAKIRCFCEAPDIATPFSASTTFSIPTPRMGLAQEVFPNPSGSVLSLRLSGVGPFRVQIVDQLGRLRKSVEFTSAGTYQLDLSGLDNGIHYYEIFSSEESTTGSLVK